MTLLDRQRVPLRGHPVSTGAACPRKTQHLGCPWVGGASRRCCRSTSGTGVGIPNDNLPHRRLSREQAYLPAEQPSSPQGARFPSAHAHPCRSRHPVLASPQGPQQARRLSRGRSARPCCPGRTGSRRRTTSVARVRGGPRAGSRTLVRPPRGRPTTPRTALASGFVVSKAVGNAVVRNRVQRRLRHLAREHLASLPGSAVLVVRALPAVGDGVVRRNSAPTSPLSGRRG